MNINEEIELIFIESKEELLTYFLGISELFAETFGKPLDKELWEWAYLNNPFGEPKVAISMHNKVVVGHYAVIPMNIENKDKELCGFLSMTTMVSLSFRKFGLFQLLAEMVYERIQCLDYPAIVFGFPNDNSVPGFKKRLGWTISDDYKVVTLDPKQIPDVVVMIESMLDENFYTLNMEKEYINSWRTSKPNQAWSYTNKIGTKEIGQGLDLMHISDANKLNLLNYNKPINMILPINKNSNLNDLQVSFPYRFGYRVFNFNHEPNLFVQMSMSDIF